MFSNTYMYTCAYVLPIFLVIIPRKIAGEVVYLCFDSPAASAELSCPRGSKMKVVESLYVRSQWDACFYQYGAGDCAQKTDIGFDCCGRDKCHVKAKKAYLPACGFSTLLRLVYECITEEAQLQCNSNDETPKLAPILPIQKGKQPRRKTKIKAVVPSDIPPGSTELHPIEVKYSPAPNIAKPSKIRHEPELGAGGKERPIRPRPRRPRKRTSSSKNSTAYGLLGSGVIIIIILSALLAFLWWRRKREERQKANTRAKTIKIEHSVGSTEESAVNVNIPQLGGHTNKGFESDNIMVSVLPEAPPRRKRKRRFPSFLGVKEIKGLMPAQSSRSSLQDYDGESLSDSGTEVPGVNRNKCLTRPSTENRPGDYSGDIERLQQNFVTRDARAKPTTEV